MVKIISKRNKYKEYIEDMQTYSVYYKDDAWEEELEFFAPNDIIALLEIYYDIADFELSAQEARHIWRRDKEEFLENVYEDFDGMPEVDEVREEIRFGSETDGIRIIKNEDTGEVLFKR